VLDGFHDRRNPMETVMRKFTTLFLVALAVTIGASQAFAQSNTGSNSVGAVDKPDRPDPPDRDDGAKDDGGDPVTPTSRLTLIGPRCPNDLRCPPRKPKRIMVKKETEECSCVHKVMRVNGRFMPFIDCYKAIEINGRDQLRYCTRDDES
jgi:hypothetical protein